MSDHCSPARLLVGEFLAELDRSGLTAHRALLERASSAARGPNDQLDLGDRPDAGRVAQRHLPAALSAVRTATTEALSAALEALTTAVRWTQTSGYVAAPPHEDFLSGYAHGALLGPPEAAPVFVDPRSSVIVGLLLLGPTNLYPRHEHPADEVYLPLTEAEWSSGPDAPFQNKPAGNSIHHQPWQPHAIRTGASPLLAVYLWTGNLHTAARFC